MQTHTERERERERERISQAIINLPLAAVNIISVQFLP